MNKPPFTLRFKSVFIIACVVLGIILANITHSPVVAQRISPTDIWETVYQKLPDLPKENTYISKETGKAAEANTLIGRLIRYHIYVKGRAPIYRLDWKLTLGDYLNVNEIMYDTSYPGNDSLTENPLDGDRIAISKLSRRQRDELVQVLVNIFNPSTQTPTTTTPQTNQTSPQQPQRGGANLLKTQNGKTD